MCCFSICDKRFKPCFIVAFIHTHQCYISPWDSKKKTSIRSLGLNFFFFSLFQLHFIDDKSHTICLAVSDACNILRWADWLEEENTIYQSSSSWQRRCGQPCRLSLLTLLASPSMRMKGCCLDRQLALWTWVVGFSIVKQESLLLIYLLSFHCTCTSWLKTLLCHGWRIGNSSKQLSEAGTGIFSFVTRQLQEGKHEAVLATNPNTIYVSGTPCQLHSNSSADRPPFY